MAKGKSRKIARAYGRRKLQTRRRERNREATANLAIEEAKKKRTANLFQNILGLVVASGMNENLLSKAAAISKATRTNYLTNMLRKKQVAYAKRQAELRYNKPNALHQAIQDANVVEVKRILKEKKISIEDQFAERITPLEAALASFDIYRNQLEQKQDALREIVALLLTNKAKIRKQALFELWQLDYENLNYLLDTHREFCHRSIVYQKEILQDLRDQLHMIKDNINDYSQEWDRAYQGYYVPQSLYDDYDKQEERIRSFKTFVKSYNPETGEYWLTYPENYIEDQDNAANLAQQLAEENDQANNEAGFVPAPLVFDY
jgi:hypothetical protein